MARPLTSDDLRHLADKLDADDKDVTIAALQKRVEELEGRKPSRAELLEILGVETSEEAEELLQTEEEEKPADEEKPEPEAEEEKPPKVKTRPGRKSGTAYSWTLDDEGKVEKLDIPHIYTGPDEPDEVELAPVEEPAA